ncbi:hypothetical protein TRVA0_043S00738 [Trichomonascus vanleenenianus]|uniref:uncharacterized protein n=1 Tax=Trichomonascus vanleenenianus TaxID=2268995 RepID=UPI003EC9ADE1
MANSTNIVFSLSDLLRESPTSPHFPQRRESNASTAKTSSASTSLFHPRLSFLEHRDVSIKPLKIDSSHKPHATVNTAASEPPAVKPFVLSNNRREKNLRGTNCCFCEEPLEYTLVGEKVIALECSHVCHYECLLQMTDIRAPKEGDTAGLPMCPTCDAMAKPIDSSLEHELVKDKLMSPPMISASSVFGSSSSSSYNRSFGSPRGHRVMGRSPYSRGNPCIPGYSPVTPLSGRKFTSPIAPFEPFPSLPSGNGSEYSLRTHASSNYSATPQMPFEFDSPEIPFTPEMQTPSTLPSLTSTSPESMRFTSPASTASLTRIRSSSITSELSTPPRRKLNPIHDTPEKVRPATRIFSLPFKASKKKADRDEKSQSGVSGASSTSELSSCLNVAVVPEVPTAMPLESCDSTVQVMVTVSVPSNPYASKYNWTSTDMSIQSYIVKKLKRSIQDWKKLDFKRFGNLRLHGTFFLSKDQASWQEVTCYMFDNIILCVKDFTTKYGAKSAYVKATINFNDLIHCSVKNKVLTLNIDNATIQSIYISSEDDSLLHTWQAALCDQGLEFAFDNIGLGLFTPGLPNRLSHGAAAKQMAKPPVDFVLVIPESQSSQETRFAAIKATIENLLQQMNEFDRLGVVAYGSTCWSTKLTKKRNKKHWKECFSKIKQCEGPCKYDLAAALTAAQQILTAEKHPSTVQAVYLLGDAASIEHTVELDVALDRSPPVHAFGLTLNHDQNPLAYCGMATEGSYSYLREWNLLEQYILGRLKTDQMTVFQDVQIQLEPLTGATITSIAGNLAGVDKALLTEKGSQSANFSPESLKRINLQNLVSGQKRSLLVQVSIPPGRIIGNTTTLPLFKLHVDHTTIHRIKHRTSTIADIKVDNSMFLTPPATPSGKHTKFDRKSLYSIYVDASDVEQPLAHMSLASTTDLATAYNDTEGFNFVVPQSYDIRVINRRIELVSASYLEMILNLMSNSSNSREYNTTSCISYVEDACQMINDLVSCHYHQVTSKDVPCEHEEECIATEKLAMDTTATFKKLGEKVGKPGVFESDTRKWMIQMVGALRLQQV